MTATRTATTLSTVEVPKDTSFTLAKDDSGRRFVATAAITITLPNPGVLGNGFQCRVINDSGGSVIIDGRGLTNVTMSDGDVARILEVNSKQRVVDEASTVIGDLFVVDPLWDPTVFVSDLDLAHWWDATRGITLDATTGNITKWDDAVALDNTLHYTKEGYQGVQTTAAKQPAWLNNNEVAFNGAALGLTVKTQSRNGWESRWFAMLFRVNWTSMSAATDSFLFSMNGFDANTHGQEQPRLNFLHATHEVEAMWYTNEDATFGKRGVKVVVPGADDSWHSIVARRDEDAIHLSVDGKAEVSLACYPRAFLDSGSSPTGMIGNGKTGGSSINWGLDTLLTGQGAVSADEVAAIHGWMMHRRGAEAHLDSGSPYLVDAPTMALADFHVPRPDSYSAGYRFPPTGSSATVGWDDTVRGNAVSTTGATRVFHDHFTTLSTLTDGLTGTGSHFWVPAHIDTSTAKFRRPSQAPTDTYTILGDGTTLQIKLSQIGGTGAWYSGHIQTVDCWGNGNTFQCPVGGYVYFEARLAFNDAVGWPAFWLYSQHAFKDSSMTNAEIDIVEAYGSAGTSQKQHHATCFTHPAYRQQIGNIHDGASSRSPSKVTDMTQAPFSSPTDLFDGTGNGLPGTFHTYGMKIDATWMTWYFDGKAISRFPTYAEALEPLYAIVSLQVQGGTTTVETYLWADYVDVYTHA